MPAAVASAVKGVLARLDPALPIAKVSRIEDLRVGVDRAAALQHGAAHRARLLRRAARGGRRLRSRHLFGDAADLGDRPAHGARRRRRRCVPAGRRGSRARRARRRRARIRRRRGTGPGVREPAVRSPAHRSADVRRIRRRARARRPAGRQRARRARRAHRRGRGAASRSSGTSGGAQWYHLALQPLQFEEIPHEEVPGGRRAAVRGRIAARAADGHRDARSGAAAGRGFREVGEGVDDAAVLHQSAGRSPAAGEGDPDAEGRCSATTSARRTS